MLGDQGFAHDARHDNAPGDDERSLPYLSPCRPPGFHTLDINSGSVINLYVPKPQPKTGIIPLNVIHYKGNRLLLHDCTWDCGACGCGACDGGAPATGAPATGVPAPHVAPSFNSNVHLLTCPFVLPSPVPRARDSARRGAGLLQRRGPGLSLGVGRHAQRCWCVLHQGAPSGRRPTLFSPPTL